MIKLDYSDWVYEYERCYDIYDEYGIDFYLHVLALLEHTYPDFFSAWLQDAIEFDDSEEGVIHEIK